MNKSAKKALLIKPTTKGCLFSFRQLFVPRGNFLLGWDKDIWDIAVEAIVIKAIAD